MLLTKLLVNYYKYSVTIEKKINIPATQGHVGDFSGGSKFGNGVHIIP